MKTFRVITLFTLVVLLFSLASLTTVAQSIPATPSPTGVGDLPDAAQVALSTALGRDDSAYHFQPTTTGWRATQARQGLVLRLADAGAEIDAGDARLTLKLLAYGYGDALTPVTPTPIHASQNRAAYDHGALTEWYVNGPLGLAQGFTVAAPPPIDPAASRRPGPSSPPSALTLVMALDTDLTATVDAGGAALSFARADGAIALRYSGLTAFDATGKELPAWLELFPAPLLSRSGQEVAIRVDTTEAHYPITIDPWIRKAKLTASDGATSDYFGYSVAISGDTIVVGAECDDSWRGSAYVFVKPAGGWGNMTQTAKLTASDRAANDLFGISVGISGDTVVVGAVWKASRRGAAYVFVKPAGGWSDMTQTAKLTAADGEKNDWFGVSAAISADAIVVGAEGDDFWKGSAYVFVKPAGGWSDMTQTAKLTASDGAGDDRLGDSAAISGDTIVVGAIYDDSDRGAAYVFVRPTNGWSDATQTAKLTASDGSASDYFGGSVAISDDAIVVGANGVQSYTGAAYVFVKPAGGWGDMTQTAKLTASDGAMYVGESVAISGNTAVVSAGGSMYVFIRPASGWADTTQTATFTTSDGMAVAISGGVIVVGEYSAASYKGAAYVFGADPIYVDPLGSCDSQTPCYTSLQNGIDAVVTPGTAIAYPGTYTESVTLGENITVTLTGTQFYLDGSLSQSGGVFNAPTTTLTLTGDLTRTGGAFNHNNGTLVFAGSGAQTIIGDFTFYELSVGSSVTLTTASSVTVEGTLTNAGWTKEMRTVTGVGALNFGLANISVDVTTQGSLSSLEVIRRDQDHPQATAPLQTGKYWALTPNAEAGSYSVNLTLPTDFTPDAKDKVCRYDGPAAPGYHWNCAQDARAANSVTRNNINQLSDWTIGDDAGPTAVVVSGWQRRAPAMWPLGLVGLAALALVVGIGRMPIARRRPTR